MIYLSTENKEKRGRNYGVWGIVYAIGAIIFPRLGIVLVPAAIILGLVALQRKENIVGIAAIALGVAGAALIFFFM